MRPLGPFTVEQSLPPEIAGLMEIARNLRWSWQGDAQDLFRRLDPERWEQCYHNPVAMLGRMDQVRLNKMASDDGFLAHLQRVYDDLQQYMQKPGWWTNTHGESKQPQVAYFCAEFGISECLPIYSGGLGVLAGDHLKSASELDIPLVGVGLLYQHGYFRQRLNADGWQLELFPRNNFYNMPVELVREPAGSPLLIEIDLAGSPFKAQIWRVQVGRVSLYLLDTNIPGNSPEDRHITAQLYGGDQEMRLQQQIVLGIGGVGALVALGIEPEVCHINEGYSAFLGLERIRQLMASQGVSFHEAREAVAASNVLTMHTPIPAGNDAFEPWLIDKYFANYWTQLGLEREEFLALGRQDPDNSEEPMSLMVMAMRLSGFRNGVSELHGTVSRKLWSGVWQGVPINEQPIQHITNGIHISSWISEELAELYDLYLSKDWQERSDDPSVWEALDEVPDTELWRTHERQRERLVSLARQRLREQHSRCGRGADQPATAEEVLDPNVLTIGFARRIATYKRATLIFEDIDRLSELLNCTKMPMQLIFAGKVHPRDNPGKDIIRQIVHFTRRPEFRQRVVFLEDYDMNVARHLVQGVDVWLSTPLRPMEASGTSGMKVAANGGLNVSILDGWWAEGYSPDVGWAIGFGEAYDDLEYQNSVESECLYHLLEEQVVPLFYNRGTDGLPCAWIARMKTSIRKFAPFFNANRMVREYTEKFYRPAMSRWGELTREDFAGARALSEWKRQLAGRFPDIRIESISDNLTGASRIGIAVRIEATVAMGQFSPDDVTVQLYHGRLDEDGQLTAGHAVDMVATGKPDSNGRVRFVIEMPCSRTGKAGYTVRILPRHRAMRNCMEMGLIRWA